MFLSPTSSKFNLIPLTLDKNTLCSWHIAHHCGSDRVMNYSDYVLIGEDDENRIL